VILTPTNSVIQCCSGSLHGTLSSPDWLLLLLLLLLIFETIEVQ
jgi:hypothetical protein